MQESHVVTCFVENCGRILIVRRSSQVSTYQQRWSGISGYIEPQHTDLEQAWEELGEEAGLTEQDAVLVKQGEVLVIEDSDLGRRWFIHPFRFALEETLKIRLDWENLEYRWVEPEEIKSYPTVPGLYAAWEKVK
ncbi:MAG: NUDIX pyrophosphatase [Syntrophomonadaceae bacterium]